MDDLISRVEEDRDDYLELLGQLVEMESPTDRKDLVDSLGSFIADHMRAQGLETHREDRERVGNIVWGEWSGPPECRLLVLCHIDTVWPEGSLKRNPFRMEEGRVYGPGTFDMKSGVAATLKVQEYLARGWLSPRRTVRFVYTTDEETGSRHSEDLIREFAAGSDVVLITEPPLPGGALKTFRKGISRYTVKALGRPAHSGLEPEKGVSAVEELAHQILAVHRMASLELGTSVAVNVIRGGTAANVIPESAEGVVDVRFRTLEEGERVEAGMKGLEAQLKGARLEVRGGMERPPMVETERSREVFRRAAAIAAQMGMEITAGESGGGSDGNLTSAMGIPTLDGLGVPGDGAHAWHEHVLADAIAARVALLARVIEKL